MAEEQEKPPALGDRMLEIVVGIIVIGGIMVLLVGWPIMELFAAHETGMARFTRSKRDVLPAEKPFLFWSIIASKLFTILLGIGGAAFAFSLFFLRKPPIRW
jgi:predicted membrane protein